MYDVVTISSRSTSNIEKKRKKSLKEKKDHVFEKRDVWSNKVSLSYYNEPISIQAR